MADLLARSLALMPAALIGGCGDAAVPAANQTAAAPARPAASGPAAAAERLVRQRAGTGEVRFEESHAFANNGAAIVCGVYSQPGRPHQRFVAVSDVDIWLESEMAPGEMDRAVAEFCRNGAANA